MDARHRERRLKRAGARLQAACLAAAVAVPAAAALALLAAPDRPWAEAPAALQALAGAAALAPALLLGWALLAAGRCCALFRRGRFLTRDNAAALRATAGRGALAAAAGLTAPTAIGLLLTAAAPPGERTLVLQIGSGPLLGLLLAGLLWAMAEVMAQAAEMAEDHAQIV
jgi:hypothetical protein